MANQERHLRISGAVIPDDAAIERLTGYEALGTPFEYQAILVSASPKLDLAKFIGDTVTVELEMDAKDSWRYFNGYVTEAALIETFKRHARYRLTLRPFLWLLTARTNSRIFQKKSVPTIVKGLLTEHGFDSVQTPLEGSYPLLDYVVQYRESDFAFVSRLMEEAGIYYYFKHEQEKHVLVLADAESAHGKPVGDTDTFLFRPQENGRPSWPKDHIDTWEMQQRFRSGAFASKDFNFEMPRVDLLSRSKSTVTQKQAGTMELFEYPGRYLTAGDGSHIVRTRIQEVQTEVETVAAAGDVRALGTGELFTLDDFPIESQNKKYLVTTARFEAVNNPLESGQDASSGTTYRVHFDCLDSKTPFRPARRTPLPRIEGPQTAIVVGEGGAEIFTDKYGRVKVQFHWDREGQKNESSSCWVRVSQAWAGNQWGAVHLPRIGQEVVVDFLEGDPDQPLVVGRVYNADNMVPYALPGNKTQSGIKSRSSLGGAPYNFNELRFEDKKGSEHVYLQAEKDLQILVKHDERRQVGHDRVKEVVHDETTSIGHDRNETVDNNETISIGGSRNENVGGSESVTVAMNREHTVGIQESVTVGAARSLTVGASDSTSVGGSQSVSVGSSQTVDVGKDQGTTIGANRTLTVGKDDNVTIGGKSVTSVEKDTTISVGTKMVIDVTDELTLKSGDASIILKKNGDITIKGKNITVDGSGKVNIKASGDVVIKGSKIAGN